MAVECVLTTPKTGRHGWVLQGFEKEAEEDVGGKQDEGEDDGAAHAAPGGHAFLFLFL